MGGGEASSYFEKRGMAVWGANRPSTLAAVASLLGLLGVPLTPEVSVIIPCLNAARVLPEQLTAIAAQDLAAPWELIIADNGSTDATREIAFSFAAKLPDLRVVDASERRGQAFARNLAARSARGSKLLFVDADDVVAPGWAAALARALDTHGFVASRFDLELLNPPWVLASRENPQATGSTPTRIRRTSTTPAAADWACGTRSTIGSGDSTRAMPLLEDTDYCWRIQRAGTPLVFVPEAVVHVRLRHDLAGVFRQALAYGEHNVAIYKKYLPAGMPRLPVAGGLLRWAKLGLTLPGALLPSVRPRVVWQLGWRLGRLRGSWRYRVAAL